MYAVIKLNNPALDVAKAAIADYSRFEADEEFESSVRNLKEFVSQFNGAMNKNREDAIAEKTYRNAPGCHDIVYRDGDNIVFKELGSTITFNIKDNTVVLSGARCSMRDASTRVARDVVEAACDFGGYNVLEYDTLTPELLVHETFDEYVELVGEDCDLVSNNAVKDRIYNINCAVSHAAWVAAKGNSAEWYVKEFERTCEITKRYELSDDEVDELYENPEGFCKKWLGDNPEAVYQAVTHRPAD